MEHSGTWIIKLCLVTGRQYMIVPRKFQKFQDNDNAAPKCRERARVFICYTVPVVQYIDALVILIGWFLRVGGLLPQCLNSRFKREMRGP